MIAGQRELVAAARAGAFDRADIVLAGIGARGLERIARLVGELAEIHLVRMGRDTEHADVGARAEHPILARSQHDRAHFRVLEPHALHDVGEFDIDAEIVGIEFELIAVEQTAVFVDVHEQGRDGAVIRHAPVPIPRGIGLEIDALGQTALSRVVFIGYMHNNAYYGEGQGRILSDAQHFASLRDTRRRNRHCELGEAVQGSSPASPLSSTRFVR